MVFGDPAVLDDVLVEISFSIHIHRGSQDEMKYISLLQFSSPPDVQQFQSKVIAPKHEF